MAFEASSASWRSGDAGARRNPVARLYSGLAGPRFRTLLRKTEADMHLAERHVGDVTVLDLTGMLTLTDGAGRLREKVGALLLQGRSRIVVNLAQVAYIDSAGLGDIGASHARAARGGGAMKLASPGKRTRDLLVTTNLLTVFDCFDSEADAIASFRLRS